MWVTTLVLGLVLGAALAVLAIFLGVPIMQLVMGRPSDPKFRTFNNVHNMPYPLFWAAATYNRMVELFVQGKPGPMRVAEVAMAYIQSQVGV
jgi:Na+-driven multidrug efflux pump